MHIGRYNPLVDVFTELNMYKRTQWFLIFALAALLSQQALHAACPAGDPRLVVDRMINLDVSGTESQLAQLRARDPQDPMLDFLNAMAILNRAYTTEKIDRAVEDQALIPLKQAVSTAQSRIDSGDNQPEVRLALGLSQAFVASIYFAHERSMKAYKFGMAGRETLEQLVAEHPEIEDAYLGLGLYNYYLGSIDSKGMKFGAKMLGMTGDRELGILYLEQAVRNAAVVSPVAARVLLMEVDLPETERCKYQSLAKQMQNTYFGNRIFGLIAKIIPLECHLAESEGIAVAPDEGLQIHPGCNAYNSTVVGY